MKFFQKRTGCGWHGACSTAARWFGTMRIDAGVSVGSRARITEETRDDGARLLTVKREG